MDIVPLSLKIAYTLFLGILVPVYWIYWGPKNFLWFSDIALLATATALWLESSLLASMMTLAVALPELAWNVDFFGRLITGRQLLGLSNYMFDQGKALPLRALSLFHVVLPVVLAAVVGVLALRMASIAAMCCIASSRPITPAGDAAAGAPVPAVGPPATASNASTSAPAPTRTGPPSHTPPSTTCSPISPSSTRASSSATPAPTADAHLAS